jgi:probable rRNA maturation factor
MEIGITIRDAAWRKALPEARRVTRKAALAALALTADPPAHELAIVLADDALLRALNKAYRGVDKATNVLAFGYAGGEPSGAHGAPGAPGAHGAHGAHGAPGAPGAHGADDILGDVVVALESARAEADEAERSLQAHLSHLVIHGVLHLLGYDHDTDRNAEAMEDLEIQALAGIGIANPYTSSPAVIKK